MRHAAEKHPLQSPPAVGPDHDEPGPDLSGDVGDALGGVALSVANVHQTSGAQAPRFRSRIRETSFSQSAFKRLHVGNDLPDEPSRRLIHVKQHDSLSPPPGECGSHLTGAVR